MAIASPEAAKSKNSGKATKAKASSPSSSTESIKLKPSKLKLLNTIVYLMKMRNVEFIEKANLSAQSGVGGASTIRAALKYFKDNGLVIVNGKHVGATALGISLADPDAIQVPTDNEAYHKSFKEKKKLTERDIMVFDLLSDGRTMNKHDIVEHFGWELNSTWRAIVSRLKKAGALETKGDMMRLTDDMFPIKDRPRN